MSGSQKLFQTCFFFCLFVEYVAKEPQDTSTDSSHVMQRNVNTMFLTELFMGQSVTQSQQQKKKHFSDRNLVKDFFIIKKKGGEMACI